MGWLEEKMEAHNSKVYYKKNLSNLHHQLIGFYNSLFSTELGISIGFGIIPMFNTKKKKVIFGGLNMSKSLANKLGISLNALRFSYLAHEEGERYYHHVNPPIKEFSERDIIRHALLEASKDVEPSGPTDIEMIISIAEGVAAGATNKALDKFGFEEAKSEDSIFDKLKDKRYSLQDVVKSGVPLTYIGYDYGKYFKVVKYFSGLDEKDFQKEVRKDPKELYLEILA